MDDIDRKLLNLLQTDFPLTQKPYVVLGERLGISEDETMVRIEVLRERKIIRQISAIFDSNMLGYKSSLAAFSVPEDRVQEVAEIVSAHPGVSHNYERNHAYNLWFTITVPPGTTPEAEVDRLAAKARPQAVRMFPTIRLFKIGVAFDMMADSEAEGVKLNTPSQRSELVDLDEEDIRAVRALQRDLPIDHRPFAVLSRIAQMSEDELIAKAKIFLQIGVMRRYAAVLRHREAGFTANAMAAWNVSEDKTEQIGRKMAANSAVSHCYQRPTYPDWPYSVFTMIHGRTTEDCETTAHELSEATGITDYILLFSTREFKKTRVQYYEPRES
jgi:DNA-binding Lrp family transcriptional regulator